jgi:hypothetical protein
MHTNVPDKKDCKTVNVLHLRRLAHARAAEHREGNGEEQGVQEGLDWCKNLDVLDENRVPEETDNQNVNEKNDKKSEENADKARRVLDIDNVFNHLYYGNKKVWILKCWKRCPHSGSC